MHLPWRLMTFSKFKAGLLLGLEMGGQWRRGVPTLSWAHRFCLDLDFLLKERIHHLPVHTEHSQM